MAAPLIASAAPAAAGGFPPFESQYFPSQLFWLVVTFILLYVLMSKVALPRIGGILAERSKRIGDDIAAADQFKQRSETAHAAYQKALADARTNAQSIAAAEREHQAALAAEHQAELEKQLRERLLAAEQSIASTRAAAMGNVGAIATDAAGAILERLLGKASPPREIEAAVGEAIKR
jgi:F-type H+-transporting ATPase subunit b